MYSSVSSDPAERAKALLCHYFELAKGSLDSDNQAEIGDAVDCIIQAAVEQQPDKKIARLERELASLDRHYKTLVKHLEKANIALIKTLNHLPEEMVEEINPLTEEIGSYLAD